MVVMAMAAMTMEKPKGLRLEISEDSQGDFRWALYDGAGVLSAKSCIGYANELTCVEGLRTLGVNIDKLLTEGLVYCKTYDAMREESRWRPWR